MSETLSHGQAGLSEEDNEKATQFAQYEKNTGKRLEGYSDAAKEYRQMGDDVRAQANEGYAANSEHADQWAANSWWAQAHKEQHLDQYIETARQEAEAHGVHIDLELPKE